MNIHKSVDYAIHILMLMARNEPITMRRIAEELEMSVSYIATITRPMVKSGLIRTERGCRGGMGLAVDSDKIDLWTVVTAIEGETGLPTDMKSITKSEARAKIYHSLEERCKAELRRYTIADVMKEEELELDLSGKCTCSKP